MITVECSDYKVSITGHSGYAPYGYDIVCAGVSALFNGLIASLDELTSVRFSCVVQAGNSSIDIKHPTEETKLLVSAFLLGIREIEEEYPEYLSIIN